MIYNYEILFYKTPDVFQPNLAAPLNNKPNRKLGREDALAAIDEAVAARRGAPPGQRQ